MCPSLQKWSQWQGDERGEVGGRAVVMMRKNVAQGKRDIMAGRREEEQGESRRLARGRSERGQLCAVAVP